MTRLAVLRCVTAIEPNFNTNQSINGAGFSKAVVNRDTQCLERHFALTILLSTGDIRTTKTTGNSDTNTFATHVHRGLHGTFHRTAEGNTALKLNGDAFCDELGVKFRLLDLEDVDLDLFATTHFGDFLAHHFDLLTFTANDQTRASRMKRHTHLVPSALNDDLRHGSLHELFLQVVANCEVAMQSFCILPLRCIPFGAPVFGDCKAEADRINFLSHKCVVCGDYSAETFA